MILRVLFGIALSLLALIGLSSSSQAEEAYTVRSGLMRAGPDYDYPEIRRISRDRIIDVFGCTRDFEWCDVEYDGDRGWFPADNIEFDYEGRREALIDVAPLLGLMILEFSIDDYWDRYYYDRPWYRHRDDWHDRHPHDGHSHEPHPQEPDFARTGHLPREHRNFEQGFSRPDVRHERGGQGFPELPRGAGGPQGSGGFQNHQDGHKKFCPPGQNCN